MYPRESNLWDNMDKLYVGFLKQGMREGMRESNSSMVLWDLCAEQRGVIFSLTTGGLFQFNGTNPHTIAFGDKYEISNLVEFVLYEWCHYYDDSKVIMFTFQNACLGYVLGPANNEVNETTQCIFKCSGKFIPSNTVKKLMTNHLASRNYAEKKNRDSFYKNFISILGGSIYLPPEALDPKSLLEDDNE